MNKKIFIPLVILIIAFCVVSYFFYSSRNTNIVVTDNNISTSIIYKNTEFGFNFLLPVSWQGYSIVRETWKGTALGSTTAQSGTKLLIRNPKWTQAAPYEDLPVLVFTLAQWDAYSSEAFSISAAPIKASELARNNVYVFALPARWDFDYSLEYKEAGDIIAGNPLHALTLVVNTKN